MTLRQAFTYGEKLLKEAGITDAPVDAWLLLEYVTGISRGVYFADPDRILPEAQETRYRECIRRRCEHIPLQHITGVQEFMGLEFKVNEHVLVPRQDTECLVEEAFSFLKPGLRLLDMCTGSGCILISLLKLCEQKNPKVWKTLPVYGAGVDISEDALYLAKENARKNQVKAVWYQGDLFHALEEKNGQFDIIVSNPPYIRTEVIASLEEEVRLHDPWIALDGREDGLYFYRKIIAGSTSYLKQGGRLLFEIGHDQAVDVTALMEMHGFGQIQVKKDLAGLDRVVSGVYNS